MSPPGYCIYRGGLSIVRVRRVVTVSLSGYSVDTVLPSFADCLSKLPNLHTLRICHAHHKLAADLNEVFEGKNYPQIRTVILPVCARELLRACSNVRDVTCSGYEDGILLKVINENCRHVEALEGFQIYAGSLCA